MPKLKRKILFANLKDPPKAKKPKIPLLQRIASMTDKEIENYQKRFEGSVRFEEPKYKVLTCLNCNKRFRYYQKEVNETLPTQCINCTKYESTTQIHNINLSRPILCNLCKFTYLLSPDKISEVFELQNGKPTKCKKCLEKLHSKTTSVRKRRLARVLEPTKSVKYRTENVRVGFNIKQITKPIPISSPPAVQSHIEPSKTFHYSCFICHSSQDLRVSEINLHFKSINGRYKCNSCASRLQNPYNIIHKQAIKGDIPTKYFLIKCIDTTLPEQKNNIFYFEFDEFCISIAGSKDDTEALKELLLSKRKKHFYRDELIPILKPSQGDVFFPKVNNKPWRVTKVSAIIRKTVSPAPPAKPEISIKKANIIKINFSQIEDLSKTQTSIIKLDNWTYEITGPYAEVQRFRRWIKKISEGKENKDKLLESHTKDQIIIDQVSIMPWSVTKT